MAHRPKRLILSRRATIAFGLTAVVVVAGAGLWLLSAGGAAQAPALQRLAIAPRPFTVTLTVAGTVVPSERVDVVAPFDGVLRRLAFDYGRLVTAGAVLVEMDDFELVQRRREAASAYLKAGQANADLTNWSTGPDASRARRAVTTAELDLKDTDRKLAETRALLDRGLVARGEYESLVQQQRTQAMAAVSTREDLAAALKRGEGANRRIALMDLETAKARLADLDVQAAGAVVRAPVGGIIVRPPVDKVLGGEDLHAGLRVTRGQLLGSIAPAGGLAVAVRLDEADAVRVREGQAVTVTGPGFAGAAARGRIVSVAGEASAPDAGAGGPTFAAIARIERLTPAQTRAIRIGMSADLTITTYDVAKALVVPPEAVRGAAPTATVLVEDFRSGRTRPIAVTLGEVAADGVEILSGLAPGDVVVWSSVQERKSSN